MLSKKRWRPSLPLRYDSGVNNTSGPPSKHNDKPPSARFNRRNKNRSFSNGRLELSVHHPRPCLSTSILRQALTGSVSPRRRRSPRLLAVSRHAHNGPKNHLVIRRAILLNT